MPLINKEYELWMDIQEIIGNATHWPRKIRELFWTKKLNHWERVLITAFVYVNGLHPDVFLEWAELKCLYVTQEQYCHMTYLLNRYLTTPYKRYAWNVTMGRYENIDGSPKLYKVCNYT